MIIRERDRTPFFKRKKVYVISGIVLAFVLVFFALSFEKKPNRQPAEFSCDAEQLEDVGGGAFLFIGKNKNKFLNGSSQSDEFHRSGKFSSKVDKVNPYGMGIETEDLIGGEVLEVSIFLKSPSGTGLLVLDGSWGYYQTEISGVGDRTKGWEELKTTVYIPDAVKDPKIKIYAFNPEEGAAFFDDLKIRRVRRAKPSPYPDYSEDSLVAMNIRIDDQGMDKIKGIRSRAMKLGLLKQGDDAWVKAQLEVGGKKLPGKIRLKGDWTDHLVGKKWSFRIQMKEGYAWNRLVTFSVQTPRSRNYLDEWVYHKLLHDQDVLAPRYDFLQVKLNGKSLGIYAWEEHFVKQLPEFNSRREGPILKFSEAGFWDVQDVQLNESMEILHRLPITEGATIEPFQAGRVLGDSTLRSQFEIAQNLMFEYMYSAKSVGEIFDLDRLANYIALIDVCHAHHGFIWHNQRFYFNPVTQKLEPIGFDGYTSGGPLKWIKRPFIGYARNIKYQHPSYRENMFQRFFLDREFLEYYIKALLKITQPDYLKNFMGNLKGDIDLREKLIQKEFKKYEYNRDFIGKNAREIRRILFPFKAASVKVYYEGKSGQNHRYKVFNWHCLPVSLVGLGLKEEKKDHSLNEEIFLPAYGDHLPPDFIEFEASAKGNFIFFTIPGIDSVFSARVLNWKAPINFTPQQELFSNLKLVTNDLYVVDSNEIRFKPGKHIIDYDVIIPEGYIVRFVAGTSLDFVKKAKFISKSVVYMIGEEESPILIHSSDQSANGFTVLQVWERSMMRFVQFSGFNTLNYKGWVLTGAVTFYESKVDIENCKFLNNHCEDGLNLVRSNFTLQNSLISNTPFDGFDADFCEGRIVNSVFLDTGNDGMDFSGSKIWITKCKVENSKDKGLSAGEKSIIEVRSLSINGAVLGIASKDLSKVNVEFLSLKNVDQGFACYRKKPEFGPAEIHVSEYESENVRTLHTIEKGSFLQLGDQEIQGTK